MTNFDFPFRSTRRAGLRAFRGGKTALAIGLSALLTLPLSLSASSWQNAVPVALTAVADAKSEIFPGLPSVFRGVTGLLTRVAVTSGVRIVTTAGIRN